MWSRRCTGLVSWQLVRSVALRSGFQFYGRSSSIAAKEAERAMWSPGHDPCDQGCLSRTLQPCTLRLRPCDAAVFRRGNQATCAPLLDWSPRPLSYGNGDEARQFAIDRLPIPRHPENATSPDLLRTPSLSEKRKRCTVPVLILASAGSIL